MAASTMQKIGAMNVASNIDATSYATGSGTPVSSSVYYVAVGARRAAGQTVEPTLAGTNGFNVAWAVVGASVLSNDIRLTVFRGTASSGTAGTLTATFTGETQDCCSIGVYRVTAVNAAPAQTKTGTATSTTITVTFDGGLSDVWNAVALFLANNAATGAMTAGVDDVAHYIVAPQLAASDGARVNVRFCPGNLSAITASGMTSSDIAALLVEFDHDGSDVSSAGVGAGRSVPRGVAY